MIKYYREISDYEEAVLKNDLLDIQDWINKAIEGKIAKCTQRMADAEKQRLIANGADTIPARIEDLCKSAMNCKEYLNRIERESITKGL